MLGCVRTVLIVGAVLGLVSCVSAPAQTAQLGCDVAVEPIAYPVPVYPAVYAETGRGDLCEVRFRIDGQGEAYDFQPRCTYAAFAEASVAALMKVRFDPALARQLSTDEPCAIYAFEYAIEES